MVKAEYYEDFKAHISLNNFKLHDEISRNVWTSKYAPNEAKISNRSFTF